MSPFLTPLAGLFLALAVIPPLIVLYFLKLRRRPQPITSTLLWKKSVEDLRANAPFQKLRKSLLLFLQLLALILLILSVMQPQFEGGRQKGGRTVILIDNSASMEATDVEAAANRLAFAKQQARDLIEDLHGGGVFSGSAGETMLIAFSDRAEVYSQFSSSKQQLLAAIDRIEPTHGETEIDEALTLARAYTTNVNPDQPGRSLGEPATLEVFTDGRIRDMNEQVLRGETLIYHPMGTPEADNVAIATIAVERPFDAPTAVQVFAALLNYNRQEVACQLELSVNGNVLMGGVQRVSVEAATINPATGLLEPGRNNIVFSPFEQPRDAHIVVRNLREDDLSVDNTAQVVVPPAKRLRVALVQERSWVVRSALEGMPLESITSMTPDDFENLASSGRLDQFDVYVLDNWAPETLPPARYLSFGVTPPLEGLNEFGQGGQQFVLNAKDEHPALRFVSTDNIYISKFTQLQPSDDVAVLAEGNRGPAIVEISRGPLKVVHVTFDPLSDSNWPLLRSFVTFVFNCVEYLGHSGEAVASEGLVPGQAITTRLPTTASDITVSLPDGESDQVTVTDPALFSWGPARITGFHRVSWNEPDVSDPLERFFAVNLLSETEGEIGVLPTLNIGKGEVDVQEIEGARFTQLWPWAIGVCLLVVMFEWWVYHKKAYI